MRVFAMICVFLMLSVGLIACLDTIFEGNDDDDYDDADIPEPVLRDVSKDYHPFEVVSEGLYSDVPADDFYSHLLSFNVKNISDIGICKVDCRVWAMKEDNSIANAQEPDKFDITAEKSKILYPGYTWEAAVHFDSDLHKFSELENVEFKYSFSWEKCKADVDKISIVNGVADGNPTALVTVKNTGGIPVHDVTAVVSVIAMLAGESIASDLIVFKSGGTLMPGDTAEATAVFEGKELDFGGMEYFHRVDIDFTEGEGPDV